MKREIIFESHSTSHHNEQKIASGHLDSSLSTTGREQAIALGRRYEGRVPDLVLCSDLKRSYETARLAFPSIPRIQSPLLREWNYGKYNGKSAAQVEKLKFQCIYLSFPGGEDLKSVVGRILEFIDMQLKQSSSQRIMIIGHRATFYALEHKYHKLSLENILSIPWVWRPGWYYYFD